MPDLCLRASVARARGSTGLAEFLAHDRGLATPSWALRPERFLDRMWFVSEVPGFRGSGVPGDRARADAGRAQAARSLLDTAADVLAVVLAVYGDRVDSAARGFVEELFAR